MPTPALSDLAAWTLHLCEAPLPVLAATAADIERLAQAEERHGRVDANMLADVIGDDPLMTIKLLAHTARLRPPAQVTDAETVTATLVHLGIGPFFRDFAALVAVEQGLQALPGALDALQRVLRCSHRASRFALGFAVHRMDTDADIVREAALVHDFAELLLWYHAPQVMLTEATRPDVSRLGQALMRAWRLPTLLIELTDEHACRNPLVEPQRQVVQLAVRLARHTTNGWDTTDLQPDLEAVAELLHLSVSAAQRLVLDLDS